MKLSMQIGLGPGHTVLDGDPAPLPKPPIFGPYLLWPKGCMYQDTTSTQVDLGLGDIVLYADSALLP